MRRADGGLRSASSPDFGRCLPERRGGRPRGARRESGRSGQRRSGFYRQRLFLGPSSVVEYNGGGSGGSNKGTNNPEYLSEVESRIESFMAAHPYLSRGDVPSELVTASGSGLDPDISVRGAEVQIRRVAASRGMSEVRCVRSVDASVERPWLGLFGTYKVNVLSSTSLSIRRRDGEANGWKLIVLIPVKSTVYVETGRDRRDCC